jgi:hypothetical protein
MVRVRDLGRDVVLLEGHVGRRRGEHVPRLAGRQALQFGDVVLDDETAAGLEVAGRVAEGVDLPVLGRQIGDRVADQVDEPERRIDAGRGVVADGHADVGVAAPGLEFVDHGGREFDPVDGHAAASQRQREAARADAELQRGTVSRQGREEVHGRVDDSGIEQFGPQVRVPPGDPLVESGLGHGPTIRDRTGASHRIASGRKL